MLRSVTVLCLALSCCGQPQQRGSSVTITLPPPKPSVAPGFSDPISESVR